MPNALAVGHSASTMMVDAPEVPQAAGERPAKRDYSTRMGLLVVATVVAWGACLWALCGVWRARGISRKARRVMMAVVSGGVGALLTTLVLVFHAFHVFAGETLVARVTAQWLSPDTFELAYRPAAAAPSAALRAQLRGDQWMVSGGVVRWHPWLTVLGVPSYHKPLRLSGQFSRLDRMRAEPPSVFALEPGDDWVWEALYRCAPFLPFIEAVYGSSAYVYVEPKVAYEIHVTPSGYLIKRAASP